MAWLAGKAALITGAIGHTAANHGIGGLMRLYAAPGRAGIVDKR